ncbi:MAG: chromosome segregation protein ScpA, partial [Planctomycetota bacterium]
MSEYRVALDVYNGPLDLLLYLIRREEVDIHEIPIATITEQYLRYVELLKEIDPEGVSEFLVMAATLMEIKSRMLLPTPPPEEAEEDLADPRLELVRQLLAYKKFKDAAYRLDQAAAVQALKHPRAPVVPPKQDDEVELSDIDIWDLFNAFNRLLEQTGKRDAVHRVGIDDTPLALHAEDIVDSLTRAGGSQLFEEIFAGRSRPEMIGLFLAVLELIRQRRIRVTQEEPLGPIWIHLLDPTPLDEEVEYTEFEEEEAFGGPDTERREGTDDPASNIAAEAVDPAQPFSAAE